MKKYKINWIQKDLSIYNALGSPQERLDYYTSLAEEDRQKNNYPWSTLISPTSEKMDFFEISLTSKITCKFTDEIIEAFEKMSKDIIRDSSNMDIYAKADALRITVPKKILEHTKSAICDVLNVAQNVVKEDESWVDD